MSRELLKRVLNALADKDVPSTISNAILINDIEEELAKPEHEPVGYVLLSGHGNHFRRKITEELKVFWRPVYFNQSEPQHQTHSEQS